MLEARVRFPQAASTLESSSLGAILGVQQVHIQPVVEKSSTPL